MAGFLYHRRLTGDHAMPHFVSAMSEERVVVGCAFPPVPQAVAPSTTPLYTGGLDCPLCRQAEAAVYARAHGRTYFRCRRCLLVFVDPAQRLDAEAEREHYGTHENDPSDAGYRRFLGRLAVPLAARLDAGASGLDYGSGPGPTLSLMLEEQGFRMHIFDPFFAPDAAALGRTYDFVTATEVVEHFHSPREEFDRLQRLLRPDGWLGVMTELVDEDRDFSMWRYARDPTHVSLYSPATMQWIADHYGWRMESPERNVTLFRRLGTSLSAEASRSDVDPATFAS